MDQNVSYPFIREIPNKPPPPYPQHRLPVAPALPTDEHIKEMVYNRIEQLYNGIMDDTGNPTDATYIMPPSPIVNASQASDVPSPMSPPLTNEPTSNVYERIFLDICDEFMAEFKQQQKHSGKQPLAFYNPPNRLICLQDYVVGRIHKLLGRQSGLSIAGNNAQSIRKPTPTMSFVIVNNRRKRDLVDEVRFMQITRMQ